MGCWLVRAEANKPATRTSPTTKKPLVPCKNPKVLFDLKHLHLLLELPDIFRIVDFLDTQGYEFLSLISHSDEWVPVRQNVSKAKATIEKGDYYFIYALQKYIEVPNDRTYTIKQEDAYWKRSEVIRIGFKYHICTFRNEDNTLGILYTTDPTFDTSNTEIGLSIDIKFSNEYVHGERILQKSKSFRTVTARLLALLATEFVSWRGPDCFDNPAVNVREFGDRFRKKAKVKGNR